MEQIKESHEKIHRYTKLCTAAEKMTGWLTENASALLAVLVCIGLLSVGMLLPNGHEMAIYDDVVRFHIRANSDDADDQELKMYVRRFVLEKLGEITDGCRSAADARRAVEQRLDEVTRTAEKALIRAGSSQSVRVYTGRKHFGLRAYDGMTLPAGEYYSVIVELGEGRGHNFWCVVFPALCGSAVTEEGLRSSGLDEEEIDLVRGMEKPEIRIKFRIMDWFQAIRLFFRKISH